MDERQMQLSELLRGWRARLHPADVGLPSRGFRRVPGLRSTEVAELAEVSAGWYEQFESGRSHRGFSVKFVQRIAIALRLSDEEQATLFELVFPKVTRATRVVEESARNGAAGYVAQARDFVRRLASVSSFEDASRAMIEAAQTILRPSCVTVASIRNGSAAPETFAVGPRAGLVGPGLAQCMFDMNSTVRDGSVVLCEDSPYPGSDLCEAAHPVRIQSSDGHETAGVHAVPADAYRSYNGRLLQRSELAIGLFENETWRGVVSCSWTEPRSHQPIEIATIETLVAVVALIAAPFSSRLALV
jgi:hypothetical protein